MTSTVFVNGVTLTDDDWFNDLNRLHYTIFGDPATLAATRTTILPFVDSTSLVSGSSDTTKQLRFEVDGVTSSTTRVFTVANSDSRIGMTSGTSTALSGTSVNFSTLPAGLKRITIQYVGLSTNGTSLPIIQIGESGASYLTSTYLGAVTHLPNAGAINSLRTTAGMGLTAGIGSTSILYGMVTLTLQNAATNTWTASINTGYTDADQTAFGSFSASLAGTLDRVRIIMTNGTDAFDAGTANILYE